MKWYIVVDGVVGFDDVVFVFDGLFYWILILMGEVVGFDLYGNCVVVVKFLLGFNLIIFLKDDRLFVL